MKLNARKDVPVNETWDLSLIFAAEADFEAAVEKAKALADTLEKTYKNALTTPESIAECLALYEELEILLYQTTSYTSLAVSVDYTDTEAQKKDAKMTALAAEIGSRLSFIESEIADAPEELIRAAMDKTGRAKALSCGDPPREAAPPQRRDRKGPRRTPSGIQRALRHLPHDEARRHEVRLLHRERQGIPARLLALRGRV